MDIGQAVRYTDERGKTHDAVVTAEFGVDPTSHSHSHPSINVVYVSKDEGETDQYGRQIKRETSVVHKTNQYAHGRFWE